MKKFELLFYISVCVGIFINNSSYAIISGMFENVTGFWSLIALGIAGMLCIVIADAIACLAYKYPSAPGIRTYLKKAFPNRVSLFFVYLYIFFLLIAGAVESSVFGNIYRLIFPGADPVFIFSSMIFLIVVVNLYGLRLSRSVQFVTTVVMCFIILFLGIYVVANGPAGRSADFMDISNGLIYLQHLPAAVGIGFFLFVGFEWVTPLGFSKSSYEVKIPASMPIAIIIGTLVYGIFIIGASFTLPRTQIVNTNVYQLELAKQITFMDGRWIIVLLSSLCVISTFNAGIMGGARLLYALGRENKLPKVLTRISLRNGNPYVAIITLGVLVEALTIPVYYTGSELVFAVAASSLMCFIYIMLMISSMRILKGNIQSSGFTGYFSDSTKKVVIFLLAGVGMATLFSLPGKERYVLGLLCGLSALALGMCVYYGREKASVTGSIQDPVL